MTCYYIIIYLLEMLIVIFVTIEYFECKEIMGRKEISVRWSVSFIFRCQATSAGDFIYELFCYNMIYSSYLNMYLRII